MHSESGNDVDIVTRRMIGGAIKRDCPQFQSKLTEYYKSNFSSNTQPVNSKPEPINSKFVGTFQCSPYDSRDTRPQPPLTKLTYLSLDSRGSNYVLKGISNDERRNFDIPLNSKLHLISERLIPYTSEPMKISHDGKFTVSILGKSNVCTYSGIAQISPEASTRIFGKRADETSVRASNANPPQPPVRLNNQKFEPESPKILLSSNISSSEAQVLEKLNSVPVFTITDATGKPLFGKNDTNSPQVLFFFLNPDDATAYLNWIKNTNPELSENARIITRSLTDAYQTIKKNQDRKDITFQITPSKSSLDSAREILPSQGKFANKLPNIPVFFAIGNTNGTNGLLTLTQDGKQFVPYFFDLKDLQSLINRAMQAQPNTVNSTKVQVTSLYYVIDSMIETKNGKPNPETERFEFIPSRSVFEYINQNSSSK
jgi:hypothetical protein